MNDKIEINNPEKFVRYIEKDYNQQFHALKNKAKPFIYNKWYSGYFVPRVYIGKPNEKKV